jgi:hypothetical protein
MQPPKHTNKAKYDYLKSLIAKSSDITGGGIITNQINFILGGAPGGQFFQNYNQPIKPGPIKIYNGGTLRTSVDNFSKHHSYNKIRTINLSNGRKRTISYRKSGYSSLFKKYLDSSDWQKFDEDSRNYRHIVYDLTILQNNKSQPVGIYAPFNCKIVETRGNPNSALALIGIGSDKGKTAMFLHILPSSQNTNTSTQFPDSVLIQLNNETLNKTFSKGQLIAYQGNWGQYSTGTHLHVEAMTQEDFDQYITNLPTFYPK